jgi:preprotein translocase subunit SecF
MQIFKKVPTFDFMGQRKRFLVLSTVLVLAALIAAFTIGPKFGIDFMGGTEIQVSFKNPATSAEVRNTLAKLGFPGSEVVTFGAHESEYLIRLQTISPVSEEQAKAARQKFERSLPDNKISRFDLSPGGDKLTIHAAKEVSIAELEQAVSNAGLSLAEQTGELQQAREQAAAEDEDEDEGEETAKRCESSTCTWPHQEKRIYEVSLKGVAERVMDGFRGTDFGAGAVKMRSEWVGPKVGKQLRIAGISSIVYALLFIMLYIAVRFDIRFAPGAVVALVHDVMITVGVFTLARVEVTLATIAALLTIVGYSLNDTIVVFDRIRENLAKIRERKLSQVINISINETLSRTLLTSMTTLIVVIVLLTVGWKTTIRDFAFALLIGVLIGTYSSIFIAAPIVVWLDRRFGKKKV